MCDNKGYTYNIPTSISGSELNRFICSGYNTLRKGAQCTGSTLKTMDQRCFQMVPLVLIVLNTSITGFFISFFN